LVRSDTVSDMVSDTGLDTVPHTVPDAVPVTVQELPRYPGRCCNFLPMSNVMRV